MQFAKDTRETSPTLTREILMTMSRWSRKVMSWTFAWTDQIRSRNLSSMYLPIPRIRHAVPDQKPTRSPKPRPRLQRALIGRLESANAGFDFEKREPILRGTIWTPSDRESMEEPRGKMPRRAETSESVVPFHSSEASSTSTAAASGNPTGERLYVSMIEEGPSGGYIMTMQRDRQGRWIPTKGERTMNNQEAREERGSFYVGESKEFGTFFECVGRGERAAWRILSSTERRRGILETPFCRRANAIFECNRNRMARSTRFQGCDDHRSCASGRDQRKTR